MASKDPKYNRDGLGLHGGPRFVPVGVNLEWMPRQEFFPVLVKDGRLSPRGAGKTGPCGGRASPGAAPGQARVGICSPGVGAGLRGRDVPKRKPGVWAGFGLNRHHGIFLLKVGWGGQICLGALGTRRLIRYQKWGALNKPTGGVPSNMG